MEVQRRARAFTLIELMVALLVALIGLTIAYELIVGVLRGQKSSDARSSRALLEAQMLEILLRDLRSVAPGSSGQAVDNPFPGLPETGQSVSFMRWVYVNGELQTRQVEWARASENRIVRRAEGEPEKVFDFNGLLGADVKLRFRVEPIAVQFGGTK